MIRFGVLGAAKITKEALIVPCAAEPGAEIRVIAARDRARAEAQAGEADIPIVVESYADVVAHPECDSIYVPLPISHHHDWALEALRAGKHVLCEKAMASNAREAEEMAAVANEQGRVLMEAFHYRYHPVFARAKEIAGSGVLGTIREIRAEFSLPFSFPEDDIRMRYETGGGVTMDIGTYPISWVRHLLEEEPDEITAVAVAGPPDIDLALSAKMSFPSGVVAETCGDMTGEKPGFVAEIEVRGEDGRLLVQNPLAPQHGHSIELTVDGATTTETCDQRPTYSYQLDAFIAAVDKGEVPETDAADAVKQARVIDRCYEAAGMRPRGEH